MNKGGSRIYWPKPKLTIAAFFKGKPGARQALSSRQPGKPVSKGAGGPGNRPPGRPTAGPGGKAANKPGGKSIAAPVAKPVTVPAAKPVAAPRAKPVTTPVAKPVATPAAKPVATPTGRPAAKPAARPAGKSAAKPVAKPVAKPTLAFAIGQVAGKVLPFYKRVAASGQFAGQWSEAVVDLDLSQMEKLLKKASPGIGRHELATNGIGYFVQFPFAKPINAYVSGTTILPGSAQFVFEPEAHQAVAAAVYPLYCSLARDRGFARSLARIIGEDDPEAAAVLIRSRVKAKTLKSVAIESGGVALTFRFPFSKHSYRSLLFQDETN